MFWLYTNCVLPLLRALYVPLDWLLGWTTLLSPVVALVIVGALTGLAINLFQKYLSNQALLALCKADLQRIRELRRTARQARDKDALARLAGLARRISGRYAWGAFKPALWSIPPICVIALWTGSRLSLLPVRPDEVIRVVAHFEDGAAGFAHLIPNDGIAPAGPLIAPVAVPRAQPGDTGPLDPQARWQVRAVKEGEFPVTVRFNSQTYELRVPVSTRGGRAADSPRVFNLQTPTHDNLLALELRLTDSVPPAWWNLKLQWLGLYFVVAAVCGVALRRVLRVQ